MVKKEFRKNSSGAWELFVDDNSFGLSFIIPEQYTMDDYKINFTERKVVPCKDAIFILSEPSKMKNLEISLSSNITFAKGLKIKIEEMLKLGKNPSITLVDNNSQEIQSFKSLAIEKNKDTIITFYERTKRHPKGIEKLDFMIFDNRAVSPGYHSIISNNHSFNFGCAVGIKKLLLSDIKSKNGIKLLTGEASYIRMKNLELLTSEDQGSSSLNIDSNAIFFDSTQLWVLGSNELTLRHPNNDITVFDSSGVKESTMNFMNSNTQITARAITFGHWESTKFPMISFQGKNYIESLNRLMVFGQAHLEETKLISPTISLMFAHTSTFKRSTIEFSKDIAPDPEGLKFNQIREFDAKDTNIKDVDGVLKGALENVEGEKLILSKEEPPAILINGLWVNKKTTFNNLVINGPKFFSTNLMANTEEEKKLSLNNVVVQGEENTVINYDKDTEINNTILNSAELSIMGNKSTNPIFKIENSIVTDSVTLRDMDSVTNSELENATIIGKEDFRSFADGWVKDETITTTENEKERKQDTTVLNMNGWDRL